MGGMIESSCEKFTAQSKNAHIECLHKYLQIFNVRNIPSAALISVFI